MAVPKKRKSKSKTRSRRATHDVLAKPGLGYCPECGEPKLAHRVCMSCGMYKGAQVIEVVEYE